MNLNSNLNDPYLNVMEFLNEVTLRYPKAISFAPGRPDPAFFNLKDSNHHLNLFVAHRAKTTGLSEDAVWADLGQYNKTKGIICEELAHMLRKDENIDVDPSSIVVTSGAQEAMILILSTICEPGNDVILVSDPSYIGFTGFAKIFGLEICLVKSTSEGIDLVDLEQKLQELHQKGKHPKIVYDIPDFHNPTGSYLSKEKRIQLLHLAEQYNFWVVEDNPYGMFIYEGEKVPTIKALDKNKRSIYIGSFSKSLYPSLRIGYIVANQVLSNGAFLSNELTKVKSLTTVITSSITQAITGGILVESDYSLETINQSKKQGYFNKWQTLLNALDQEFSGTANEWAKDISWNKPKGGFFLTMNLPFSVDESTLDRCVEKYGVIFCPMSMFFLAPGPRNQIRLSFSYLNLDQIKEGISKLAVFLKSELE